MKEGMEKVTKVLWLIAAITVLYTVFAVATMHQCDESQASPSYTPGDENFDCRTMASQTCSDTGSGQGGRYYTPGHYEYGIWQKPLH